MTARSRKHRLSLAIEATLITVAARLRGLLGPPDAVRLPECEADLREAADELKTAGAAVVELRRLNYTEAALDWCDRLQAYFDAEDAIDLLLGNDIIDKEGD